jgi:hypothetical protein
MSTVNKSELYKKIEDKMSKLGKFNVDLDENVKDIKTNFREFSQKNFDPNFLENITRRIYAKPKYIGYLELIQFVLFIVLLYVFNPLDIHTNYPVLSKVLILLVACIYVVLFFFLDGQIGAGVVDVDSSNPSEYDMVIRIIATLAFFVVFVICVQGLIWAFRNTPLVNALRHIMTILIAMGLLGVVYIFLKKSIDKTQNAPERGFMALFVKFIMLVPCLLVDLADYVKYHFNLTTKPVWILLGFEAVFLFGWFVLPFVLNKMVNYNSLKLLSEPVSLINETTLGNFAQLRADNTEAPLTSLDALYSDTENEKTAKDLVTQARTEQYVANQEKLGFNYTDPNIPANPILAWFYKKVINIPTVKVKFLNHPQYTESSTKRFRYKYSLSAWFYINPQPPNTREAYNKYTNILSYGNKVRVEYNGKLQSLRVMAATSEDNLAQIYETTEMPYQKWNNIVINYNDGYMDIFLNGSLAGSRSGVVPYMALDNIFAGERDGLNGGICNVTYSENTLSKNEVIMAYKSLRDKDQPYVWSITDSLPKPTISEFKAASGKAEQTFGQSFKKFFAIQ